MMSRWRLREQVLDGSMRADAGWRRTQKVRDSTDGHFMMDYVEFGGCDNDVDFGNEQKHEDEDLETPFDIQDEFGSVEYKNDNIAEDDKLLCVRIVRAFRSVR
jgi:hypothetical protein